MQRDSMVTKITKGCVIFNAPTSLANKTGGWRTMKPIVDEEKCKKCNICWQFCPDSSIEPADRKENHPIKINYDYCKGCGICAAECPFKAITMVMEEK